jgi:uncharacterized membrane protein
VIYPAPRWEDYLALGIDEIRIYGAHSLQVMRRLGALLDDLEEDVPPRRRQAVELHARRVQATIQRHFRDAFDRQDAEQVDRQGLGLGREPEEEQPPT